MARTVKCQWCEEKQPFDENVMTFIVHEADGGKKTKKYFHNECLIKYKEKQAFLDSEKNDLDILVLIVGEVHEMPKVDGSYKLPRKWYHTIQDWRNGTQRYTRGFKKKYKNGIPYKVLIEAYKISKDSIRWSKMTKQFRDFESELHYGLAIVNNKISDAMKRLNREEHMKKVAKVKEQEIIDNMKHEREVEYKPKKASYDISDFLDD